LSRLFEVFLAEEPRRIAKLDAAVAAGDLETVNFLAHSLKGAAATMGMERLCDAARELEQAAKDSGTADLADRLALVEREVQAVFAVVRAF
jgi:HPt (histidine-containing phosphotransfer) domain-containing protein